MSRLWQASADEPLVSFAVIGGLLFAINGFRSNRDSQETIEAEVRKSFRLWPLCSLAAF